MRLYDTTEEPPHDNNLLQKDFLLPNTESWSGVSQDSLERLVMETVYGLGVLIQYLQLSEEGQVLVAKIKNTILSRDYPKLSGYLVYLQNFSQIQLKIHNLFNHLQFIFNSCRDQDISDYNNPFWNICTNHLESIN